jgi:hypothetical protein
MPAAVQLLKLIGGEKLFPPGGEFHFPHDGQFRFP